MTRKMIVSYNTSASARTGASAWYLATKTDVVQFYCFNVPADSESPMPFTVIDTLDRTQLTGAGDRATARNWAKRLGLTSWTYVRI